MKRSKKLTFLNSNPRRSLQAYRKAHGIGLDGNPRRYGRKPSKEKAKR